MHKFRTAVLAAVLLGSAALIGCGGERAYNAGVSIGPPPPLVYAPIGVAPGPAYVWTDGYYDWAGGAWVWRPGRWARPPHSGYVWRKPYYEHYRSGYRVHPGHWDRR